MVKKLKNFFWNFEQFQETICNNNCRRLTQRSQNGGFRSLVENDRLPSFLGAPDAGLCLAQGTHTVGNNLLHVGHLARARAGDTER